MSGGVDSSVAAALLQAQGHEVVGVTLQQWPRDDSEESARHGGCCSLSAVDDARRGGGLLGLPYFCLDLGGEVCERGIAPVPPRNLEGRAPQPCAGCKAVRRFY